MPKANRPNDPFESEDYKKLVADLKVIIDDARAKGIDLGERMDVLTCATCDSYEEITSRGDHIVVDPMHRTVSLSQFLIIDSVEKTLTRKKVRYFKTTYTYICSSCGAYQNAVVRDRFDI